MWRISRSSISTRIIINVFLVNLQTTCVLGTASSCQDIDHNACVSMAKQVPDMCADPHISVSACPLFCNKCPTICYSCVTTSYDVSDCNPITCRDNEMCLMKTIENTTAVVYEMSCDTRKICTSKKRAFDIHCCGTNLCNAPKPLTTPLTTESVPPTTIPQTTFKPSSSSTAMLSSTTTPTSTAKVTQTLSTISHLPITSSIQTKGPTSPLTSQSTLSKFALSTFPPYTPYHLTTIPWLHSPTVSLPYTLTTLPPQHRNQSYTLALANQNLMHSINASCQSGVLVLVDESCLNYTFNHIVKRILFDITNQLDVGTRKVHVGLSTFNTRIYSHWDLDRYTHKGDLQNALDQLTIQGEGHSDSFVVVDSLLNNTMAADVVLLFSNVRGRSIQSNSRNLADDIAQIHRMFRRIVIINLDDADIEDLAHVASDAFQIFSIPPYTHDYLVEWILHEICPDVVN